jgi:hypothetical protein
MKMETTKPGPATSVKALAKEWVDCWDRMEKRISRRGLRGFQFIFRRLFGLKEVMSIRSQKQAGGGILIEYIKYIE